MGSFQKVFCKEPSEFEYDRYCCKFTWPCQLQSPNYSVPQLELWRWQQYSYSVSQLLRSNWCNKAMSICGLYWTLQKPYLVSVPTNSFPLSLRIFSSYLNKIGSTWCLSALPTDDAASSLTGIVVAHSEYKSMNNGVCFHVRIRVCFHVRIGVCFHVRIEVTSMYVLECAFM